MTGVPEEVKELEPCTLLCRLGQVNFLQAMLDVYFPHGIETLVSGVGEVTKQGVIFVIIGGQDFLDEDFVIGDDGTSQQCLFGACLVQLYHVVQLAFAELLLYFPPFFLAADYIQSTIGNEVCDFHNCKQVEVVLDLIVNIDEGCLGPYPLNCLSLSLPLLQLFQRHSIQLMPIGGNHIALTLSITVRFYADSFLIIHFQTLTFSHFLVHVLHLVREVLLFNGCQDLVLSRSGISLEDFSFRYWYSNSSEGEITICGIAQASIHTSSAFFTLQLECIYLMFGEVTCKTVDVGGINEHLRVISQIFFDFVFEDCVVSDEDVVFARYGRKLVLVVFYIIGKGVKLQNVGHAMPGLHAIDNDKSSVRADQLAQNGGLSQVEYLRPIIENLIPLLNMLKGPLSHLSVLVPHIDVLPRHAPLMVENVETTRQDEFVISGQVHDKVSVVVTVKQRGEIEAFILFK